MKTRTKLIAKTGFAIMVLLFILGQKQEKVTPVPQPTPPSASEEFAAVDQNVLPSINLFAKNLV